MPATKIAVLYLSHAPEDVYEIIREAVPDGFRLVTLDNDDDDERREKIKDVEAVVVAATPLTPDLLGAAYRLRLVQHQGVGYHDTVPVADLAKRHITLALAPEGTTTAVAEHTVLLMLATLRRLSYADSELRAGNWHINTLRPVSRNLAGRTIGYVGMGRIGQAVAKRLKNFETSGLYFDPVALSAGVEEELNVRRAPLDEVLSKGDIVTLHLPVTTDTRHIIDARALAKMKIGAFIINTARGPLIDEAALYNALSAGRVAGAGLDVFEREPPTGSLLLNLPNVVVTPHISAGTRDALIEKMRAVFANIERFFRGEPLNNAVDVRAYLQAR